MGSTFWEISNILYWPYAVWSSNVCAKCFADMLSSDGQRLVHLTTIVSSYGTTWLLLIIKKTTAVSSRIWSKLIFANCMGYFDRAYYWVRGEQNLTKSWTVLKARDWLGHVFADRASPTAPTKTLSMSPSSAVHRGHDQNMWYSRIYCKRQLCLAQNWV